MIMSNSKVALITGASSGIGRSTAIEFARSGYKVSVLGRRIKQLEKTAELCIAVGLERKDIKVIQCDVLDDDQVKESLDKTINYFERLDVVVNNAGYSPQGSFIEAKMVDFDEMYRIHVRAPTLIMKLSFPYLKEKCGNIINISSIASEYLVSNLAAYSIAKAALNTATLLAAKSFFDEGNVRVNAILPGPVNTDIMNTVFESMEEKDTYLEELRELSPLKELAEPRDIAQAILFLARDSTGKNINGAKFVISDGHDLLDM